MLDSFVKIWGDLLNPIMTFCYKISGNYGIAIFLFTVVAKIILFPLTVILHLNSIKMIKMKPELNFAQAEYSGDKDTLGEIQLKLYKEYKYHPMLGLIPLIIQIILLMGVIDVVHRQLTPGMTFLGLDMWAIPVDVKPMLIVPLMAGVSAALLCIVQNRFNVLQSEQGILNKLSTMSLSVGLSLYLGCFVQVAVGIYWICGNLTAIAQLFLINALINPKKFIDYEQLELSRTALKKSKEKAKKANRNFLKKDPYRKREKEDYKRFYRIYDKQVVFYSEKNGFYKYFKGVIEYILKNSDIVIDYVTGDANDSVFELTSDRFRTYYIGNRRIISFMMKMDANVVVMSTPGLNKSYIKRSMMRDDIEYIYFPHGVDSSNLSSKTASLEHFDTVFAPSDRSIAEHEAIEELYGIKKKKYIKFGSALVDEMHAAYLKEGLDNKVNDIPIILIAPSWQDDNIMDLCLRDMLRSLLKTDYKVVVRPHPQYVRYNAEFLAKIAEEFKDYDRLELETDFSSNNTVYTADLLVTDWSSIAFEYAYTTLKPVLFVNTPMKVINRDWDKIDVEPINIAVRKLIGEDIEVADIAGIGELADRLIKNKEEYRKKISRIRDEELYNLDGSAKVGGQYIIDAAKDIDEHKAEYLKYLAKVN